MKQQSKKTKCRTGLFVILFLLHFNLYAQKEPTNALDSIINLRNPAFAQNESNDANQHLDSIVTEKTSKTEFIHNHNGTTQIDYTWSSINNNWRISGTSKKTEYTNDSYDEYNNKLEVYVDYKWDSKLNDWVGSSKSELFFDENGHRISTLYNWDATLNMWFGISEKSGRAFDEQGRPILSTLSFWNTDKNKWSINIKTEYVYDNDYRGTNISSVYDFRTDTLMSLSKYDYTYYSTGKDSMTISYTWDKVNSVWIEKEKKIKVYDTNGKDSLCTYYTWDIINSNWIDNEKEEWTYNTDGKQTFYGYYTWDAINNTWQENNKIEWTFNTDGKQTYNGYYRWDAANRTWGIEKYEWSYNTNGSQTYYGYYTLNTANNTWQGNEKTEYTYDANGKRTLCQSYTWDTSKGDWLSVQKTEYTYENDLTTEILSEYQTTTNSWALRNKTEYIIDSFEHQLLLADYSWQGSNGWVGSRKDERTYDANGSEILHIYYTWDTQNKNWISWTKTETIYNYTLVTPRIAKKIKTNNIGTSQTATYYYSDQEMSGVEQIAKDNNILYIYLSPASEFIGFTIKDASIVLQEVRSYDLSGKLLGKSPASANAEIPLNTLNISQKGYYILEVYTSVGTFRQKLIIKSS